LLLTLGKFSLQDHVHLDAPVSSPDWDRMDCVVKSWILGSLTDDLAEIISSQGGTARDTWLAVESQFLGNREMRAIQLETRFRNFIQGDLSIAKYCRRLKKMTDDLDALRVVVTDCTLVLNVICGLNERFTHVGALLHHARSFPSFLDAREDLTLEELTLVNQQPSPAAALATTTRFSQQPPQPSGSNSGGGGGAREQLQEQQLSQQAWRRVVAAPQRRAAATRHQGSYAANWSLAIGLQPVDGHHPHVARRTSSTSVDSPASSSAASLRRPAAATCSSCTDYGGRPVGSAQVLPPHGSPALLGHAVAGLCVQHGDTTEAPDQ
jgi:hypothetical protein